MRAVYLGTPTAAVPPLAALVDIADVPLVITRPDAAKGRSGRPSPPPVKVAAREWGMEVVQPGSSRELLAAVGREEFDIGVVVAYGRILSTEVLAATRVGFVNLHYSLLPRWRGPAPVERCLLAGDEMTGVSLMHLDEGMDTGPIIAAVETPVADDETGGTMTARLSYLAGTLLAEALPAFMTGSLHLAAQISAGATYAARLSPEEGELDPARPATSLGRQVRAFTPRPGAWVPVAGRRLKIWAATPADGELVAGRIDWLDGHVTLGCSEGVLRLDAVQPAGKTPMSAATWMHGRRDEAVDLGW